MNCDTCKTAIPVSQDIGIVTESTGSNPEDVIEVYRLCPVCLANYLVDQYGSGNWRINERGDVFAVSGFDAQREFKAENVKVLAQDQYDERLRDLAQIVREIIKGNPIENDELITALHDIGMAHTN